MNEIETIINMRLNLQSTQNKLDTEFGVMLPSANTLRNERFISLFKTWDNKKQSKFLSTIGGRANLPKTKQYISSFIKQYENLI